ncbi:MAG: hypothetical protein WCG05_00965 [Alphaproteobacteria bacterium]
MTVFTSKTGLAYLVCPDLPGDETLGDGSVISTAIRVFKSEFGMKKSVFPAYNGHLNSSSQVTVSDFRMLINQNTAETFKNFCGQGKVFDSVKFIVLTSYGAPSSMAQSKLTIELNQARIATATANVPYTQYDFAGPGPVTSDLIQGGGSIDARSYSGDALKNFKSTDLFLMEVGFVFDKANFIYSPVGTDGTQEGQLATTFQVSTNSIPAAAS